MGKPKKSLRPLESSKKRKVMLKRDKGKKLLGRNLSKNKKGRGGER